MKFRCFLLALLCLSAFLSCKSTAATQALYGPEWELEYISGPRIAFNGLFPDKKPHIHFNEATQRVEGNAGCNGYSAPYTTDGQKIHFGEPGPATLMYCGEGEGQFLKMMQKVDAYQIDTEGKLLLLMGDVAMLRFKRQD